MWVVETTDDIQLLQGGLWFSVPVPAVPSILMRLRYVKAGDFNL